MFLFYTLLGSGVGDHRLEIRVKSTYDSYIQHLSQSHYVIWSHLTTLCKKVNITQRCRYLHCLLSLSTNSPFFSFQSNFIKLSLLYITFFIWLSVDSIQYTKSKDTSNWLADIVTYSQLSHSHILSICCLIIEITLIKLFSKNLKNIHFISF